MKEEYFDYIFIDECAACMEATALIPISNFGAKDGCITTNIVLLGDPKQLGPILNAIYSEKLGLDMSLMERIMYHSPYIGNEPKYVMQLVQNFRSHPAILAFSNREFYGGKLVPKLCHVEANFAIGWKKLPNKKFPLIFHSVLGASELAETSHFNEREVDVVDYYVQALLKNGINGKKVLPSDIAIISPYRAQQTKLEEKFQHLSGIEIGTVDYYQGREKKIIILTAVRSQTETVGFLKNEKVRFILDFFFFNIKIFINIYPAP